MAVSSRYIQVHPDALVEWIWDDQFFYEDEYSVISDIQNNVTSFAFSKNAIDAANYNKIPQQLYLIDIVKLLDFLLFNNSIDRIHSIV